jgi:hypothetical protein
VSGAGESRRCFCGRRQTASWFNSSDFVGRRPSQKTCTGVDRAAGKRPPTCLSRLLRFPRGRRRPAPQRRRHQQRWLPRRVLGPHKLRLPAGGGGGEKEKKNGRGGSGTSTSGTSCVCRQRLGNRIAGSVAPATTSSANPSRCRPNGRFVVVLRRQRPVAIPPHIARSDTDQAGSRRSFPTAHRRELARTSLMIGRFVALAGAAHGCRRVSPPRS